jgi:hypothetical protein
VRAVDARRSITAPTQKNVSAVVSPHLLFATCQPTIGASAALPVACALGPKAIVAVAAAESEGRERIVAQGVVRLGGPQTVKRER